MFSNFKTVLEIGAGDGFQSRIVDKEVNNLVLSDIFLESKDLFFKNKHNKNKYLIHDFTKKKLKEKFNGIYMLDVIEHIEKKNQ